MIAACPKCGARYRIDEGRLPADGARLRCSRCEAAFRVSPPRAARRARPAPSQEPASPAASPPGERVLVADAQVARGRVTAGTLAAWGLQPMLVHDGVEALMAVHRSQPRAVVLDAELPGMLGSQVCELMKRNPALGGVAVALVGAGPVVDPPRGGDEAYGPDAHLDPAQLPDGLRPVLSRLGLSLDEPARAPEPGAEAPGASQSPEPARDDALGSQIADAERLARIVVSDIILYNREKFDAALEMGNVLEAMDGELQEGRALFRQRVDARVLESRDFLAEELMRVAQQRNGR